MSEFLKMDIFFVIATIGFVILGILLVVALVYVILLLRTLSRIATTVEEEADAIMGDIDDARESIKREGINFFSSIGSLLGFVQQRKKRSSTKKRHTS
jgi:hypothetical protein